MHTERPMFSQTIVEVEGGLAVGLQGSVRSSTAVIGIWSCAEGTAVGFKRSARHAPIPRAPARSIPIGTKSGINGD
jgi:hypothetical protein